MRLRLPLLIAAALPGLLSAATEGDTLTLNDGSMLRGTVTGLSAEGAISLTPEIASNKMAVPREAINNVKFAQTEAEPETHPSLITLRNGDFLPCEVLGLDASQIRIRSWYFGEKAIPRAAVASLSLGVRPQRQVYSGPDDVTNWIENTGWRFEENALVANERGLIRRDLQLPENYILRFRLAWEGTPNFIVDFGELAGQQKQTDDRYRFSLNANGAELKRQRPGGRWAPPLFTSGQLPALRTSGEAEFEFRVDRKSQAIHLYIDGRWVKRLMDFSSPKLPAGSAITLQCMGNNQGPQQVKLLEVFEWDAMTQRHQNEGPGAGKEDSVINIDGERFGGQIRQIIGSGPDAVLLSENAHAPDGLIRISLKDVTTIYFVGPDPKVQADQAMTLQLRTKGLMTLNECRFEGDSLVCQHPLMGELRIDRRVLNSLYTSTIPASDQPDQP
jgi:hypothetical protein